MFRWMTIQGFKGCVTMCGMIGRVIPKLSQWNPLCPLLGTGMYHAAEICFKALIQSFGLAVGLWMVGRTHIKCCFSVPE